MNLIFGIVNKSGGIVDSEMVTAMRDAIYCWQPDDEMIYVDRQVGLGQLTRQVDLLPSPSTGFQVDDQLHNSQPLTIVFDGRIDNRLDLAHQLDIPRLHLHRYRDEDLVLQAYSRWQEGCCQYLLGDFVFALWNSETEQLLVARDQLGIRPLFISESSDTFTFASNQRALQVLPWVKNTINQQWVADLLCITFADANSTFYENVQVFPAAHWQMIKTAGDRRKNSNSSTTSRPQRYWRLQRSEEFDLSSDQAYIEQFRDLLEQGIAARLRSTYPIASELSGGLDSTTVSSIASRLLFHDHRQSLIACSHVLAVEDEGVYFPYSDEKTWIQELCTFANIDQCVSLTAANRGIVQALDQTARHHGSPTREDINRFGDETFEVLMKDNVRVLLSGFGGDQLASSHAYGAVEQLMLEKKFSQVWRELTRKNNIPSSIRAYLLMFAKMNLAGVYEFFRRMHQSRQWFQQAWSEHLQLLYVNPEFACQWGFPDRFFSSPLIERQGSVWCRERAMLEHPAFQFRLLDSAVGAQAAGVEYRYPLLDIRLLEFCLALPLEQKYRNGCSRHLMRMATNGILPDSIRWRQDKTRSTIPTMHRRRCRDKDRLSQCLDKFDSSSPLAHCVDLEKMKAYSKRLHKDFKRSRDGIPRAFDHAYQVLYCASNALP